MAPPFRGPRSRDHAPREHSLREHSPRIDPGLRDLLSFLRDTLRETASRIDRYLGDEAPPSRAPVARGPMPAGGTRMPLEALREEARDISASAADMDPEELRLRVEAVAAESRSLQNRAADPEDRDIAGKILRTLTAIVAEHRPGHVYGLARHHEADWDDIGKRARRDLVRFTAGGEARAPRGGRGREHEAPSHDHDEGAGATGFVEDAAENDE